jgi:hypothetical protein
MLVEDDARRQEKTRARGSFLICLSGSGRTVQVKRPTEAWGAWGPPKSLIVPEDARITQLYSEGISKIQIERGVYSKCS